MDKKERMLDNAQYDIEIGIAQTLDDLQRNVRTAIECKSLVQRGHLMETIKCGLDGHTLNNSPDEFRYAYSRAYSVVETYDTACLGFGDWEDSSRLTELRGLSILIFTAYAEQRKNR